GGMWRPRAALHTHPATAPHAGARSVFAWARPPVLSSVQTPGAGIVRCATAGGAWIVAPPVVISAQPVALATAAPSICGVVVSWRLRKPWATAGCGLIQAGSAMAHEISCASGVTNYARRVPIAAGDVSAETVAWIAVGGTAIGALLGSTTGGVVDFVLERLRERREAMVGARLVRLDLAMAGPFLKGFGEDGRGGATSGGR